MEATPKNRKQRRATKSIGRAGGAASRIALLQQEILEAKNALAVALTEFERVTENHAQALRQLRMQLDLQKEQSELIRTAFEKNHMAYYASFVQMEGHQRVQRAIINDVHLEQMVNSEGVPLTQPLLLEDGNINWQAYYDQYNDLVIAEAEKRKAEQAASGVVVVPDGEEELIFGGDVPPRKGSDEEGSGGGIEVHPGSAGTARAGSSG